MLEQLDLKPGQRVLEIGAGLGTLTVGQLWAAMRGTEAASDAELDELDVEIAELLAGVPDEERKLVTNHESMGYFADRYDFEMVGVVVPGGSTLGDPSSEELAELVLLRDFAGMSYQEIADAMESTVSSVQMLLHRAMTGLRKDLAKRRDDR